MLAADALAAFSRARAAPPDAPWPPGVSVVIPERDAPAMLGEALASLAAATAPLREPVQVIVVVNGAPLAGYAELRARHPEVQWLHDDAPLAFAGAIERGLACARHGATLLLNNDMTLEPDALAVLMAQREPRAFAIGAQILQESATGRREETGFTDWYVDRAGVHLYHAPVPAIAVADHLCASGGATLFRTALLRRYLPDSRAYDPFYWEDAEWGLRAWRDGFRVRFCAQARARHRHRATTSRFYAPEELERIVERNRLLFDARHGITGYRRGVADAARLRAALPQPERALSARLRGGRSPVATGAPAFSAAAAAAVAGRSRRALSRARLVVQLSPAHARGR